MAQYQFGGGAAYSPVNIRSASGVHDIASGDPLPDALTGLLTASAFTYTTAVAPLMFAQGDRIGDSAIHRDAYNAYFQDSWKVSDRLLLNYGLRYEIESPIREPDKRTSAPVLSLRTAVLPGSELLINPDPAYSWTRTAGGRACRSSGAPRTIPLLRVGGAITTLLINLCQDNLLTGGTPFVVYPHLTAAPGQAIPFGMTITPAQLPTVYTDGRIACLRVGRFQAGARQHRHGRAPLRAGPGRALARSPDHAADRCGHFARFPAMATSAPGRRASSKSSGGRNLSAAYVGTAGIKLPVMDFPNGYAGADPGFRALHAVRFVGQRDRRLWTGHCDDQPLALDLSRAAGVRAKESDRVGPRLSGQLHVFEIDRRHQRRDRRIHLRIFGRGLPDRAAEPVRHARRTKGRPLSTSRTRSPSACSRICMSTASPFLRPFGKNAHRRMAIAGHRDLPQRASVHHLFGHTADRRRLERHRPARSDRHARLSTSRTVREDYFGRGRRQRLVLLRSRLMCRAGPGRIRAASARSAGIRFAVRACGTSTWR